MMNESWCCFVYLGTQLGRGKKRKGEKAVLILMFSYYFFPFHNLNQKIDHLGGKNPSFPYFMTALPLKQKLKQNKNLSKS